MRRRQRMGEMSVRSGHRLGALLVTLAPPGHQLPSAFPSINPPFPYSPQLPPRDTPSPSACLPATMQHHDDNPSAPHPSSPLHDDHAPLKESPSPLSPSEDDDSSVGHSLKREPNDKGQSPRTPSGMSPSYR